MKIETLRSRRIKLRYSQYTLAQKAGISRNRLSLIECGYVKATQAELEKIKTALLENKGPSETLLKKREQL